ncbi:MAG: peptidoglycan DD-metalloendopeptidase family protein [Bacteroidales bacterium]|jgi:murein DD-endopeptidase MepM/ murein hydrolase activator NlpD|nr:peptidoglycan DD-metalloendopeptidase family protein [Bacteroidales bacterium]NLM93241.1 peptidoglycan DD-metalloendopeptidase family protein [Bacteroidales bacterium]
MHFIDHINAISDALHPLFEPELNQGNTFMLDFSGSNKDLQTIDFGNTSQLDKYISAQIRKSGKQYGYGGYLENREVYRRSALFSKNQDEARSIHLGVDIWAPAGQEVFSPLDAKIHSLQNNAQFGDYGPTIILEHKLEGKTFFTLYGHLSLESLMGLHPGDRIGPGTPFCQVGNFPVNGDWPAHLHFQVILDMMGKWGDFPGVCLASEKEDYSRICPDPIVFFRQLIA